MKKVRGRSGWECSRCCLRRRALAGERPGTVRAVRIRRKARWACRRRDEVAEVAVAVSSAGQSASSTRSLWRTLSPCAWCVCASGECRSCCTWPDSTGTGTFGQCVCGSGANGWSPVSRRPGISTAPARLATRRTSRDKKDRPARWASYLKTQHAVMRFRSSSISFLLSTSLFNYCLFIFLLSVLFCLLAIFVIRLGSGFGFDFEFGLRVTCYSACSLDGSGLCCLL